MNKFYTLSLAALLAVGTAGAAMAQQTTTLYAQPGDPNYPQGGSGDTGQIETGGDYGSQEFIDVYGSGAKYPAVGLIDFTGFPGSPTVTDGSPNYDPTFVNAIDPVLTLDLFDTAYSSSVPGTLDFYLSESNAPLGSSSLAYDPTTPNGVGSAFDAVLLGTGSYTPGTSGITDDTYDLTLPTVAAQEYVLNQLNTGGNIRILVAGDGSTPGVVAGFSGANGDAAPTLTVTTDVPEAGTPALLMLGLLGITGIGVARRRHAA